LEDLARQGIFTIELKQNFKTKYRKFCYHHEQHSPLCVVPFCLAYIRNLSVPAFQDEHMALMPDCLSKRALILLHQDLFDQTEAFDVSLDF
jgi:hypothetical protein